MEKVYINNLRPGLKLARTIYDMDGRILLKEGATLSSRMISTLEKRGILFVYIDFGFAPDLQVEEPLSEAVRQEAARQVRTFWERVKERGRLKDVKEIQSTATRMVDEILSRPEPLLSLSQIRLYDEYLFAHSVDVAVLSVLAGLSLGYGREELIAIGTCGLLHDIGKIKVSERILNKPDRLTPGEFEQIKKHTLYARGLLPGDERLVKAATQHHERFDGQGYPLGLKGDEIDPIARIIGVADAYDAMTTDRVYRPALPVNEVVEYLSAAGGHQFDLQTIKAFIENIAAYPVGSMVRLSSGEIGVVVRNRRGVPLYPVVRVLFDGQGQPVTPYEVDLARARLMVVETLGQEKLFKLSEKLS
ncbi:MAG: HD-GYP domain-containing protein [Thermoanaerobacteraceae bacterium]|nr:HD-GYP domain-containing protein [Thermoanaerobacteraceae bacterium]